MAYTICYNYQGKQVVMQCSENNLCGHDAVYYALLHSGVAFREGPSNWAGSYASICQSAEQFGVTDVRWSPTASERDVVKAPAGLVVVGTLAAGRRSSGA